MAKKPKTYGKMNLINDVAKETRYPRSEVNDILNSLMGNIVKRTNQGRHVSLQGFGNWDRKVRKGRPAYNPNTQQEQWVDTLHVVKFTPANAWKAKMKAVPVKEDEL